MVLENIKTKLSNFARSPLGKSLLRWFRRIFIAGILTWLFYQITKVGWGSVWNSLPTNPLFYLLFLLNYLSLPVFEIFIYRLTWNFEMLKSLPVFMLKKGYNKDVLGYSGEFYFYLWARKVLDVGDAYILKIIKDNNIISSIASTLISVVLLAAFLYTGQIKIMDWLANQNQVYVYGGPILLILLTAAFIRFRHYVISMPMKTALTIFGIQNLRLLMIHAVNLLMYIIVIPQTPFYVWFTLIAIEIILSRIPFLPNRDLIFTGVGIGLSVSLQVPESELTALLVVKNVLNKLFNFGIFGLTSVIEKYEILPTPDDFDPESKENPNMESVM